MIKRGLTVVLTACFLFALGCGTGAAVPGGTPAAGEPADSGSALSFQTPEDTIYTFTEQIRSGDVPEVMHTFAIEECAQGYQKEKEAELTGLDVSETGDSDVPTVESLTEEMTTQLSLFYAGLFLDPDFMLTVSGSELQEKIATPGSFSSLRLLQTDVPQVVADADADFLNFKKRHAAVYGAQDYAVRTALYDFDGQTYYCGFTLFQYGEDWKIKELHCGEVKVSLDVVTIPVSEEEYMELVQG